MNYLYWGPFPWERDGGAVVNYYLLKAQNMLRPRDVYHGLCKVQEELDASQLPWINYPIGLRTNQVAEYMFRNKIPLVNIFHVGKEDIGQTLDPIHDVGAKVVLHQTIHWPDDDILKLSRLSDIDTIVAPTNYAAKIFTNLAKVPRKNVRVIPHAVDTEKFRRRKVSLLKRQMGIKPNQKVILYSGRLNPWKGIQEIIPIVRPLVKEYDCVFIIRGSSFWGNKYGMALEDIFRRMERGNSNVIFLPDWMPPEFMEELWSFVDILVFNSGHEGFGVPLIEAQSVGAVPVGTSIANHVEICGSTGTVAILLSPTKKVGTVNDGTDVMVANSDQLYGAVKWLLDNPAEAEVMGARGRQNVLNRFSLDKIAQQWLDLYDEMIPENYSMDRVMTERLEDV